MNAYNWFYSWIKWLTIGLITSVYLLALPAAGGGGEEQEEEIAEFSHCCIYIQVFDNGQQLYFDNGP